MTKNDSFSKYISWWSFVIDNNEVNKDIKNTIGFNYQNIEQERF